MRGRYGAGLDILGAGVGDFVPWLGMVGNLAGGLLGGGGDKGGGADAQKKAIEEALAKAKAEQDAARTRTLLYVTLGAVMVGGLGVAVYAARK